MSFGELEEFGVDVQRRNALSVPRADLSRIVADRLRQWEQRFEPSKEK